jgi:hypothetical protein
MYIQKVISKTNFNKKHFLVGILSATDEKSRIRTRGTDPQIRIRTKMSRIHNTAYQYRYRTISFVASPEEGKADKGEAEPDENGHKAGQGRVPVTVAARLFLGQENRSNISDCWFSVKAR